MNRRIPSQVQSVKVASLVLAALLCLPGPANRRVQGAGRGDESTTKAGDSSSLQNARSVEYGEPILSGTVIIREQVLPRPYRVNRRGREVLVNDVVAAVLPEKDDDRADARPERARGGAKQLIATFEQHLFDDDVLIAFDDRTRVILEQERAVSFLQELLHAESLEGRIQVALNRGAGHVGNGMYGIPTAQWRSALRDFQSTDSLAAFIRRFEDDDEGENEPANGTYARRFDPTDWMYALNIVGLLLAVTSFGTLLSHRPGSGVAWATIVDSAELQRWMRSSTMLLLGLSAFDLVATLLVAASGEQFTELNPMASALLSRGGLLSLFKVAATGVGAAILWWLKRYAGAQQATWWLCLVLTLVTVRWVAIQSLFYV